MDKMIQNKDKEAPVLFGFAEAITKIKDGDKVTRKDWGNPNIHTLMKNGILMIFRDSQYNSWVISEGDIEGDDWFVVNASPKS